ncbi:hypothetical protein D9M73_139020 [compost metagenome]
MRAAFWRICSGVSNITPAGAALNSGLVGLDEWQTVQRSWMTLWILSKLSPPAWAVAWAGAAAGAAGAAAALAASSARCSAAVLPPTAVAGSGWYSIFAAACSGLTASGFGPVT